jgi:hypothetical protein
MGSQTMLGLLLDAGALMLIVSVVNEGDQLEFLKALIVAVVITIACGLAASGLAAFGLWPLLLGLVLIAALAGLVIWLTLGMTLQRSMIAGAIFLVYRIGRTLLFLWVL